MPRPRAHTCSPVCGFRRTRACQANKSSQRLRQEQVQIPRWSWHKQASNSVGELYVSHVRGEVLQMLEFAFLLVRISGSYFRKDPTVSLACRWRRAEFRPSQSPKASRVQLSSTLSYSTSNEEFELPRILSNKRLHSFRYRNHQRHRVHRRGNEPTLLIELPRPLRNRVHQNRADACDIRSLQGAQYGITEETRPDLFPLIVLMDGQPTDDHDWYWIRHVTPNTTRCVRMCYSTHSKGIIANHLLSSADHIGTRSTTFLILQRSPTQPVVQRRLATLESRHDCDLRAVSPVHSAVGCSDSLLPRRFSRKQSPQLRMAGR